MRIDACGSRRPHCLRVFDIALLVCLSIGGFIAAARIGLVPLTSSNGVAIVFAPWTAAHDSVQRATEAGARFVRFGGAEFIAIVMPETPGFAERMLGQGAWLVMDPQVLAACFGASANAGIRS